MAKSRWAGTPVIRKDHRLIGIHFFHARARKETDTVFITPAAAEENIDWWHCHGHSQVSSSLAGHLAVRPPLPVAPHHDLWLSRVNVYPQWRSTAWFFKQIQANFGGNWYCLIENRFLYIKCKERSIDCTSALMFVLSILKLSRNTIELQTVS